MRAHTPLTVIDSNGGRSFQIISGNNTYIVGYSGHMDSEHINLWTCTCPAGLHGRYCKHVDAVSHLNAILAEQSNPEDEGWKQINANTWMK